MNILKKTDNRQFQLNLPWVDLLVAGILGAIITGIVMYFVNKD